MSDFPEGDFFISNADSSLVLDVYGGGTEPGTKVIIWNKKTQGNDNQLWSYEGGFITNKNSGLVLEVSGYEDGGQITPGAPLVQAAKREQPKSLNQLWAYNYKHLMPYDPKVSVAVEGNNVTTAGSNAIVARFNFEDQRQMWNFERA